jgi:VWFA-related protein
VNSCFGFVSDFVLRISNFCSKGVLQYTFDPHWEGIAMRRLLVCTGCALLLALPAVAQPDKKSPYKIEFNESDVEQRDRSKEGKEGIYIVVRFGVSSEGKDASVNEGDWKIVIDENGKHAAVVPLPEIKTVSADLSLMLSIDTSGSMKEHNRMTMSRQAAETFLGKLPAKAECGLVLFDHEIRDAVPPTADRKLVLGRVYAKEPRGGTAFRDAALASVKMLAEVPKGRDRALVLMTDGADVNSTCSLDDVIAEAKKHRIRIYTIGIGEPGKFEQVSTTLVLDHSGSMELPADDTDPKTPKIKAMHTAAAAFVHMMSSETGRVSLIPFSSRVGSPRAFTNDRVALKKYINALEPAGETAVFDAIYTAIATLEADNAAGKRAVVAMTDGIDNSSRRRVEEVIERARAANIKLYLLGFGRKDEIDHTTMQKMANESGGQYFHASNKDKLLEIFEKLSIELHDDGIDEKSLTRLAHETGGEYYPAKDVSKLQFILETVSNELKREMREVEFASLNQRRAGDLRRISLRLVHAAGTAGSPAVEEVVGTGRYQVHGLIIAEMHPFIYLVLLAILGGLIALPAALRRPTTGA